MQYLKEQQYYVDLYDLVTIRSCLDTIEIYKKAYASGLNDARIKDISIEEKKNIFNYLLNQTLFSKIGERYRRKKITIDQWINKDTLLQNKFDNAKAPIDILCPQCNTLMFNTLHHLENYLNDGKSQIMFFFECPKCNKRKWVYENGEEKSFRAKTCKKCNEEVSIKYKKENEKITTTILCPFCKYKEIEVDDFKKYDEERIKREQEDKNLLTKYRDEFCLNEEKGENYISTVEKMQFANQAFEYEKSKYDVQYPEFTIKRWTIFQLEESMRKILQKEKYVNLKLDRPELGRHITVTFTVQDSDTTRNKEASIKNIIKVLKNLLQETNWRLLADWTNYRLGYISCKLKGYENDDEIIELLGIKKKITSNEPELEMELKYEHDNLVQLARIFGKLQGIEEAWNRRLEKEPNGFLVDDIEDRSYICKICNESIPINQRWWGKGGLRCLDCQRNIVEGIVPNEICENEKLCIKEWQLKADYNVNVAKRNKLIKEGLLHKRDLKRKDGTVYLSLYLVKENKEFLKEYPKNTTDKTRLRIIGENEEKIWL